jgi:EAL domain-containing protein (putative c-di-GMP-specific phosphodiesterase class I)
VASKPGMESVRPTRWTLTGEEASRVQQVPHPRSVRGLTRDDLDVVFHPIVNVETRQIFAYEALARCRWPEYTNPALLFAQASREASCGRLGRLLREVTFERGAGFPLFVNVHPDELNARWLVRPDDPLYFHDHHVFIEITESAAFTHHRLCKSVLSEMKARGGVFLAVDDLGAGHSNLMRVIDLEPQFVKLDRALVAGLHRSRRQQILVRHLVELCTELGAVVVEEGIETGDELQAVVDVGAKYVQGFVFAYPEYPPPKAKWPGAESLPPEDALRATFGSRR